MFEPNPIVLPALKANLGLNWHPSFDLSFLGCGLGKNVCSANIGSIAEVNLGGTQLRCEENGNIRIFPADQLFPTTKFDLVKIDAEGMERDILLGMGDILDRGVATIFVETLLTHKSDIIEMLVNLNYTLVDEYQRYQKCTNLIFRR